MHEFRRKKGEKGLRTYFFLTLSILLNQYRPGLPDGICRSAGAKRGRGGGKHRPGRRKGEIFRRPGKISCPPLWYAAKKKRHFCLKKRTFDSRQQQQAHKVLGGSTNSGHRSRRRISFRSKAEENYRLPLRRANRVNTNTANVGTVSPRTWATSDGLCLRNLPARGFAEYANTNGLGVLANNAGSIPFVQSRAVGNKLATPGKYRMQTREQLLTYSKQG